MGTCLSLEELEQFLSTTAQGQDGIRRAHLESCPACRQRLEEIRSNLTIFKELRNTPRSYFGDRYPDGSDGSATGNGGAELEGDDTSSPVDVPSIEGYELFSEVHRGAQGVVYKAFHRATRRMVALKIMLQGPYASRRQQRRFEREIDLVSGLQHPNIVRLYDSGRVGGRHWFAMEFINGPPLRDYVLASRMGIADILRLFVKVCRAVAHAHARGIIHRDLKPSNILVDEASEPHVVDFGLAKPVGGTDTGPDTLATQAGEFFGTLAYASPEQASCKPETVDVRTDVYALGMILYELLTGTNPYPITGSMSEVIDHILHSEPGRPSRYNPALNDDIDAIVQKAIEKEASRRYQSVDALAGDIERYLDGRPIEAKPHSTPYLLRKLVVRHKAASALTAVVLVFLVCLAIVLSLGARRIARERDRAVTAERRAREAEEVAKREAFEANRNLYYHYITHAYDAFEARDIGKLREMLRACPLTFRHWEYLRLCWLQDESVRSFTFHPGCVYAVAFSPDGRLVASGDHKGFLKIWSRETGDERCSIRAHALPIRGLGFSPDGRRIVSAGEDDFVRVWSVPSGLSASAPAPHQARSAVFSPNGGRILTAGSDFIHVWDSSSGALMLRFEAPGLTWPVGAGFSPDGLRIVSVHENGETVKEWDAKDGRLLSTRQVRLPKISLRFKLFHPGAAKDFHVRDVPGGLHIVDDATGRPRCELLGHVGPLHCADVSPDGAFIVTGGEDQTCRVWDTQSFGENMVWYEKPEGVKYAVYSPDGERIATAGADGSVRIYGANKTAPPLLTMKAHDSFVTSVAFSPNGTRLVSAPSGKDHTDLGLKIWDTSTGRRVGELAGHTQGVSCVAYSKDGKHIFSGSWDGSVRIWSAESGSHLHTLPHGDEVWDLAVSEDGKWIASGGKDHDVHLWDARSGERVRTMKRHADYVDALAFSPDSQSLLSGDVDGLMVCWDVTSGRMHWERDCEGNKIYSAIYTPDGGRIFIGGVGSISVYEPSAGQFVMKWSAHEGAVYSLSFSPDRRNLLSTGNRDGSFKVWPTRIYP